MAEAFIGKTQNDLGSVITAPKLTEKLLSKPPFRFLHDIVTSFLKATGFPDGLYPSEMLDSSNVTDREKKVQFLTLLIAAVEAATGQKVDAQPSKIVAGHEPENTNHMLQLLAACAPLSADKKAAAVRKAKGVGGEEPPASEKVKEQKPPGGSKEQKEGREDERNESSKSKEREKEKEKERAKEKEREREKEKEKERAKEKEREKEKEKEKERAKEKEREREKEEKEREKEKDRKRKDSEEEKRRRDEKYREEKEKEKERERRSRKENEERREQEADAGRNVSEPVTAPPAEPSAPQRKAASAGKAPPRTKPTHEVVAGFAADASPAPGVIRETVRGGDSAGAEDADEWMRVADQQHQQQQQLQAPRDGEAEARGYLGQQALQAKREQEEGMRQQQEAGKALGEGGIIIHSTRGGRGGGAMAEGEVSKLREQLQLLTKASNPLGKLLEAIHDDIDTMARELEMWRSEARNQILAAADARRQTMEGLQEVQAQVQNLEDAITDQILKTHNIRRNVINNDKAIAGMVRMIVSPYTGSST